MEKPIGNFTIILCLIICLFSCKTNQEEIILTFQVDLSKSLDKIQSPNSVGIMGVAPFLNRFKSLPMDKTSIDGVYQKSFQIPDSLIGLNIRFKFIVDTTFIENERFGWRRTTIPDKSTLLPVAEFNDLAGSTGNKVEPSPPVPVLRANSEQEKKYFESPFLGITTDGNLVKNLFSIESTGVSTKPIQEAAELFLASLSEKQKAVCTFQIDNNEWRRWHNIDLFYEREGIPLFDMDDHQKNLAFNILRESLSAKGVRKAKDIMAMEEYLKELTIQMGRNKEQVEKRLGNDKYYFTFMGEPSDTQPWGWQIDGHHLAINFFVLGDQIVMTPTFMGSEPNFIKEGRNKGLRTFEEEEREGLNFYNSLDASQKRVATLWHEKKYNFSQAEGFRDNEIVPYSGIQARELSEPQRNSLLGLIEEYIGRMRPEHAKIKMKEIESHLEDTWFCWVGGSSEDAPFYYRIQSPVIMIEFDHHEPVSLRERDKPNSRPVKWHVHTVVRTPNGNDYGKDLLRQHLEEHHH